MNISTAEINQYRTWLTDYLATHKLEDSATVKTSLGNYYFSNQDARIKNLLIELQSNIPFQSAQGGIIDVVTITNGGTGYSIGDKIVITSLTGENGGIVVDGVTLGVITSVKVVNNGTGYEDITLDATNIGNGDAVLTATFTATTAKSQVSVVQGIIDTL